MDQDHERVFKLTKEVLCVSMNRLHQGITNS